MLQVVDHRWRRLAEVLEHKDCCAGNTLDVFCCIKNIDYVLFSTMNAFGHEGTTTTPRLHLHHEDESDRKGKPSAVWNLDDVCA